MEDVDGHEPDHESEARDDERALDSVDRVVDSLRERRRRRVR
jgi:hypothetical protein